jgi:hypothetical protein
MSGTTIGNATSLTAASIQTTDNIPIERPGVSTPYKATVDAILGAMSTGPIDYSATSTVTGWASFTTKEIYYTSIGNVLFVEFDIVGTSDATTATFTLPYARAGGVTELRTPGIIVADNGAYQDLPGCIKLTTNLVATYLTGTLDAFTASGIKRVKGQFWYTIA